MKLCLYSHLNKHNFDSHSILHFAKFIKYLAYKKHSIHFDKRNKILWSCSSYKTHEKRYAWTQYDKNITSLSIMTNFIKTKCFEKWFTIEYYKACNKGTYGMDCSEQCGHCSENVCEHISGICLSGCMAGYQGNLCKTRMPVYLQI